MKIIGKIVLNLVLILFMFTAINMSAVNGKVAVGVYFILAFLFSFIGNKIFKPKTKINLRIFSVLISIITGLFIILTVYLIDCYFSSQESNQKAIDGWTDLSTATILSLLEIYFFTVIIMYQLILLIYSRNLVSNSVKQLIIDSMNDEPNSVLQKIIEHGIDKMELEDMLFHLIQNIKNKNEFSFYLTLIRINKSELTYNKLVLLKEIVHEEYIDLINDCLKTIK